MRLLSKVKGFFRWGKSQAKGAKEKVPKAPEKKAGEGGEPGAGTTA
jgi:hypothetical protein